MSLKLKWTREAWRHCGEKWHTVRLQPQCANRCWADRRGRVPQQAADICVLFSLLFAQGSMYRLRYIGRKMRTGSGGLELLISSQFLLCRFSKHLRRFVLTELKPRGKMGVLCAHHLLLSFHSYMSIVPSSPSRNTLTTSGRSTNRNSFWLAVVSGTSNVNTFPTHVYLEKKKRKKKEKKREPPNYVPHTHTHTMPYSWPFSQRAILC